MISLGKYSKTIVAVIGAGVVILGRAAGVESVIYLDVVSLLTALGVYGVENAV